MVPRVKVSADGVGVVSHAGVGLLREMADLSGLTGEVSAALADTYKGPWLHDPGRVFPDLLRPAPCSLSGEPLGVCSGLLRGRFPRPPRCLRARNPTRVEP